MALPPEIIERIVEYSIQKPRDLWNLCEDPMYRIRYSSAFNTLLVHGKKKIAGDRWVVIAIFKTGPHRQHNGLLDTLQLIMFKRVNRDFYNTIMYEIAMNKKL